MLDRISIPRVRDTNTDVSAAMLVVAAAFLLHVTHSWQVRVYLPGTTLGSTVQLTYIPGRAPMPRLSTRVNDKPADSARQVKRPDPLRPPIESTNQTLVAPPRPRPTPLRQSSSDTNAPYSETPNASSASDSWGSGDIQIAQTTYSPRPHPDLSLLAPGMQGDVMLDVTIDPSGKVADLQILHVLGYGVDSEVVETVRTWTFRPATRDGVPVALRTGAALSLRPSLSVHRSSTSPPRGESNV
jgi:protein TonB